MSRLEIIGITNLSLTELAESARKGASPFQKDETETETGLACARGDTETQKMDRQTRSGFQPRMRQIVVLVVVVIIRPVRCGRCASKTDKHWITLLKLQSASSDAGDVCLTSGA